MTLFAPSGALVFIMGYYIPSGNPPFQIFNILQILKCLKDPTCAIFLKNMGIKDIKYEGHKGHEGHHVLYFLNAAGSRISNMTFLSDKQNA